MSQVAFVIRAPTAIAQSATLASIPQENALVVREMVHRIAGDPPAPGATREDQLRWVRRFYGFTPIAIVMVAVFALLDGSAFLWIAAVVVAIIWVSGLASITMSIRKASSNAARDRLSE